MMYIGNVKLKNNVFLAPMAGITDKPFRLICANMGCGLEYSEMVSAKGLLYSSKNTEALLECDESQRPYAVQLFGSDPQIMGEMSKAISELPFDIVDINMGCPAPKIVKNGDGSALMTKPELVREIVASVCASQAKPVTVKIRKGFDENSVNAVEIALMAQKGGASAVTVHGRTREQYYSGKADWEIIKAVKEALDIPVIGNGDVSSPQKAKEMLDFTNCDAVMIGRAAEGNPWIFKNTVHFLKTGELLPQPTMAEKVDVIKKHAQMLVAFKGEFIGIREMRRHLAAYTRGLNNAAQMRGMINSIESLDEIYSLLEKYFV